MSDTADRRMSGSGAAASSGVNLDGSLTDAQRAEQQYAAERKARLDTVLTQFWRDQMHEIDSIKTGPDCTEMKNHPLPLARIKKIMKSDEDVRMISAEAPVVFAKACELFILELTHRAWAHSEDNKRKTLQRSDIAAAIAETDVLDFLLDIIPREDGGEGVLPPTSAAASGGGQAAPQSTQAMYGMGAGASGQQGQGQGMSQQVQYMQYVQWPGMGGASGSSGAQGGQQTGPNGLPVGMVMDPKLQAHMQQQMAAAQQQYMQRQMQRTNPVQLPPLPSNNSQQRSQQP